jgi:hypothetical protein
MKRVIVLFLGIIAVAGAATVFVPADVLAQTSSADAVVEGGYRLPRSHQYEVYDAAQGTYSAVDAASVPGRIAAGQWVYDRTAQLWVFHPSAGGKNPMYDAATAAPPPTPGATATQGGWQRLHGNIVSTSGSTLQFKTDDGRTLTVDTSKVGPNVRQALVPNEGATLIGFAGAQPSQFTAQYIQQDSSDPARGGKIMGQAPAPAASPAPPPAASKPADDKSWQRVHGKVGSVSGNTLTLRTDDGQTLNVDMTKVDAGIRKGLAAGEGVTVIGFYRTADKKNLDAQFIQQDSSAGAASPKTTK